MSIDNKKRHLFDLSFDLIRSGKVGEAAKTLDHIINTFDKYTANRAHQILKWYCLPIDNLYKYLHDACHPVDVNQFIQQALFPDGRVQLSQLRSTLQYVESALNSLDDCSCIGQDIWVVTPEFNRCVFHAQKEILASQSLVSLETLLEKFWPQFSASTHSFPDHTSLRSLASALEDHEIEIIEDRFAISSSAFSKAVQALTDKIQADRCPIKLESVLPSLFPDFSFKLELLALISTFFRSHLHSPLYEITPGWWITLSLITVNQSQLDEVFNRDLLPRSTQTLFLDLIFPVDSSVSEINSMLIKKFKDHLSKHPSLTQIGDDYWLPTRTLNSFLVQVVTDIQDSQKIVTSIEIRSWIRKEIIVQRPSLLRDILWQLVESHLRHHPGIFDIGQSQWLHTSLLRAHLDQIYKWMLESRHPKPISAILEYYLTFLHISKKNINFNQFYEQITSFLKSDSRFVYLDKSKLWKAVTVNAPHNDYASVVLSEEKRFLHVLEISALITKNFSITSPQIDLINDYRFREFFPQRWGLNDWVYINDLAFSYLLDQPNPLPSVTIVGAVCSKHQLNGEFAIFLPQEDDRFVCAQGETWRCIRRITPEEVDQLLRNLANLAATGISLKKLVKKVLHIDSRITDAREKLSQDSRFLCIDSMWYARAVAFKNLTPQEVDLLNQVIQARKPKDLPVPLESLVKDVLKVDYRFTDAEFKLQSDPRFKEIHSGFWAPAGFTPPKIELPPEPFTVTIRGTSDPDTELDEWDESLLPDTLTRRDRRTRTTKVNKGLTSVTLILNYLDVRHNVLRISSDLSDFISPKAKTIHLVDDLGSQWVGYLDKTQSLLQVGSWIKDRKLTYGDRINVMRGADPDSLYINPKGDRDEKTHQEAISHLDIERLIQEAQQLNKTFHDLMIDVMEAMGTPLHREDIFELVDYQRTARRSTISQILSMPDCPFVELRYFVPEGKGYWSFDRKKKEAYDMKMDELVKELDQAKEILEQVNKQKGNDYLFQETHPSVKRLKARILYLQNQRSELESELKTKEEQITSLQARIQNLMDHNQTLESGLTNVDQLKKEHQQKQDRVQGKLNELQALVESLQSEQANLKNEGETYQKQTISLTSQISQLEKQLQDSHTQVEIFQRAQQEADQKAADFESRTSASESLITKLRQENEQVRKQLEEREYDLESHSTSMAELRQKIHELDKRNTYLQGEKAQLQNRLSELNTQIDNWKNNIAAIQKLNQNILADKASLTDKVISLTEQVDSLTTQVEILSEKVLIQSDQMTEYQQNLSQLEREKTELTEALEKTRESVEFQISKKTDAQKKVAQAKIEVDRIESRYLDQISKFQDQVQSLSEELNWFKERASHVDKLQQQVDTYQTEISDLKSMLAQAKQFLEQMELKHQQKVEALKAESQSKTTQLEQAQNRASQADQFEQQVQRLTAELAELQSNLSSIEAKGLDHLNLLKEQYQQAQDQIKLNEHEISRLSLRLEQMNQALNTTIGRIFVRISGLSV